MSKISKFARHSDLMWAMIPSDIVSDLGFQSHEDLDTLVDLYAMLYPQEAEVQYNQIRKELEDLANNLKWQRLIAEEPDETKRARLQILYNGSLLKW